MVRCGKAMVTGFDVHGAVGKVTFALSMAMPGMNMRSPASIELTSVPGRYLAEVTPDMMGDWSGVVDYDGPRGNSDVQLSISVKN